MVSPITTFLLSNTYVGAIVGIAVGIVVAVIFLILLIVIIVYVVRLYNKKEVNLKVDTKVSLNYFVMHIHVMS